MLATTIVPYSVILRDSPEPVEIRRRMVLRYQETGSISQVAREFGCTRRTARKWIERFNGALSSLMNRSRAPKAPREYLSEATKEALLRFRREHPGLGYPYVASYLIAQGIAELPSKSAVYALWRKHGLLSPRKKKHERKKDCRAIKARYKAFEKLQIDVKELRDIPHYVELSLAALKEEMLRPWGLPMYQYTARDVKTGTLFVALAHENTRHNSAIFADRVLTHLDRYGITPRVIQTDNGTEFVNTKDALEETLFIQVVTRNGQTEHRRIPPGAKTFQSDVESSHNIIEREFYDVVQAKSERNLIDKLRAYQWGFNALRKNGYRGNKTPLEILREKPYPGYATLPKEILDFPTCILDEKLPAFLKGGHHVALPTERFSNDSRTGRRGVSAPLSQHSSDRSHRNGQELSGSGAGQQSDESGTQCALSPHPATDAATRLCPGQRRVSQTSGETQTDRSSDSR